MHGLNHSQRGILFIWVKRITSIVALFVLVASTFIPAASAYAAEHQAVAADAAKSHIKPAPKDADKKPGTDYAGPLPQTTEEAAPAADVMPVKSGGKQDVLSFLSKPTSDQQHGTPKAKSDKDVSAAARAQINPFAYKPGMKDKTSPRTPSKTPKHVKLLTEGRNALDKIYQNDDGTKTLVKSLVPTSYKDGNTWKDVDTSLEDNAAHDRLQTKANAWQASFGKNNIQQGVGLSVGGQTLSFTPVGGASGKPVVVTKDGKQTVTYTNVWPDVDLQYTVNGGMLKENIVIKNKAGIRSNYQFALNGATATADPSVAGQLKLDGPFKDFVIAKPTLTNANASPIANGVTQSVEGSVVSVKLDQDWANAQPTSAFPLTIDPTESWTGIGTNYASYDSHGNSCGPGSCGVRTGNDTASSYGNNYWHSVVRIPYDELNGATIMSANLDMSMSYGNPNARYVSINHAVCFGYSCHDNGITDAVQLVTSTVNTDVSGIYHEL